MSKLMYELMEMQSQIMQLHLEKELLKIELEFLAKEFEDKKLPRYQRKYLAR